MTTHDKIRVVHLINQLGRGGTERQLCLLLRHFDAERFHHRVVAFNPSRHAPWNRELEQAGVGILEVPESVRGVARRLAWLARRLRRPQPQVLHSWTVHDNPYAGVLGRLLGVPVRLGSLRGKFLSEGVRRLPSFYRSLMLRSVDRIVVNCRHLADELTGLGHPVKRVTVLPNCVEHPRQNAVSDLEALDTEGPLIGIVANLRHCKDLPTFVRAMGRVLPRHAGARALIIGQAIPAEPDIPGQVEAEIESQGLMGRVLVTGFRADVPAILERLSVACLTSLREGMPNAVLEAMAAGIPVVATRVGGVPELIRDGENGYTVEPGDDEALARRVEELLAEPATAQQIGENARRRAVEEHGCDQAARRLAKIYDESLRSKR